MKENKYPRNKALKMIRTIRGISLRELQEKSDTSLNLLSFYETGKSIPSRETVFKIAKGLEVKPDVLLLSCGYLPDKEMNIIKEDPYYFMDKIQKMCNDAESRYSKENVNVDDLNVARTYDYIIKSMEEKKKDGKTNT